jgi:hypothetical protein
MLSLVTLLVTLLQETDFNDLGKLMLGGLAAAILIAAALTVIRLKLRGKKPPPSFISITAPENDRAE